MRSAAAGKKTELMENEAKYHELIENANLIILKLDKDSKITFINEYARNYFGLDKRRSAREACLPRLLSPPSARIRCGTWGILSTT